MSQEEKDRIINGLKYQQNTIELYQCRRCNDYSFNDFSSNRITLVHPQRFNDCFEIVPFPLRKSEHRRLPQMRRWHCHHADSA